MGNSLVVNLYPKPNSSAGNMKMLTVSSSVIKLESGGFTFHEDTDVYVTYNNDQDPTADIGHILYAGNSYTWDIQTAKAAKFLRVGSDAVVAASQFTQ